MTRSVCPPPIRRLAALLAARVRAVGAVEGDAVDRRPRLVRTLRAEAGRNTHDRALIDLVGNVRYHQTGRKRLHHPTVGALELDYEVMELSADTGLLLAVFGAEPGSRAAEALDLLGSWAATPAASSAPSRPDLP